MCGIAGIFTKGRVDPELLTVMAGSIAHRGPDDQGIWTDDEAGIGFAHRRLSILDLSPQGHQPMHSASGRYVVCFNGEIYNHGEIRAELESRALTPEGGWRGHSDTEVLLQAFEAWGLGPALERMIGMFALALWDRKERKLHLARDRFGEKPLYYGWVGDNLVFGSELKVLRCHPCFDKDIDRAALKAFSSRTYVPAPLSIYRGIFKLPPGCFLTLDRSSPATDVPPMEGESGAIRLSRYWSYRNVVREGLSNPIGDEAEALDALEAVLAAAIQRQSFADVPVGAFLSGGIDSSMVVALYQKYSPRPVRTYSIGFDEDGFDEAKHAKTVAVHLGTIHHEHYVTVQEARDVIPLLPSMYDEPFADSSQIPTCLVSRFARGDVTVVLTGDGGDELFGGYNRHIMAPRLWRQLRRIPRGARSQVAAPLSRLSPGFWQGAAGLLNRGSRPFLGARIQKGLRIAQSASSIDDIYLNFLDEWSQGENPVLGARADDVCGFDLDLDADAPDAIRMMYCDAVSYLPDDILCKVDRASMSVGLETRVPFLDHRVAALAGRIPVGMKMRAGRGKHILRQLLYRQAPRELFDRPKAGFAVPVGQWIKGELRSWAEDLLNPAKMREEGWFDPEPIQRRWKDHLAGRRDSTPALWSVLMFQAWLREQKRPMAQRH